MASPYTIGGFVYDSDGTTVLANVRVSILNNSTDESGTALSNASGEYLFDIANLTSGYSIGDEISIYASYGRLYHEYVFTVDTNGYYLQNITIDLDLETAVQYTSAAAIRAFTKVQESEWTDANINEMIKMATAEIDLDTGRTWKGIQTVTDEYYDGNDADTLWLNHTDLQSVTSVAIDSSQSGTYMTVTTSPFVNSMGYIVLNKNGNLTAFTANPNSVKISYTHGNLIPTPAVRELCKLKVANMIHMERSRSEHIRDLTYQLKWKSKGML